MANQRATTPTTPSTDEAFGPRRVDSPRLDGQRRDSDQPGDSLSPESPEQESRNPPIRPINGDGRNGEAESRVAEGASGSSGAEGESAYPFSQSDNILQVIGKRWNEARDLNKAGAFRQLQRDLMTASPFLCPTLIPYKDLIQIVTDLEKEIKGSSSQVGKSNEELLANFLSSGNLIPISPSPEPATINEGESI